MKKKRSLYAISLGMISMNDKTYDILKELFNISVGSAASLLSEIIDKKILLNVPDIEILHLEDGKCKINQYLPKVLEGTLMVSSISFQNQLNGEANLIFPANRMRTFINLCLHNKEDLGQQYVNEFTDIDFDIIKEVGNIILNFIIGQIGNYLNINLNYSLPEVKIFNQIDFEKDIRNKEYAYMLMLYITFIIDDVEIKGAIILNLTLNSLTKLINKISVLEDQLYE